MKKIAIALLVCLMACSASNAQNKEVLRPGSAQVTWDRHSLIIGGKRVVPVMGEVHYSRIPETEWADEIRKMKEGGVTVIATYVFWNHIEEQQGIFDWSGQRNLRRFIELCKAEDLPVCLRIGPFCHGEVRCGGIPDWAIASGCKLRSMDPKFLGYVETLYRQIFTQVQGLQWKDGGPVMATQFDNEYRGDGAYLMALKQIAQRIGFDLPFYTRTGWPELTKPTPFGEMIPLYGDYADGFWDRNTKEGTGNYWKAFHFTSSPTSGAIGSEQLDYSQGIGQLSNGKLTYPYFTCELGGGMMTSYHRRVYLYPEDAYSMALVKLGCGSNLLGYYMYHGGTNPEGKLTNLNEEQRTPATYHNDLPVKTYDFQAPLGEFGQTNPQYYGLRPLHLFMQDFGEQLAPMEAHFPCIEKAPKQYDDTYLRWSYRTSPLTFSPSTFDSSQNVGLGGLASGFVFINNYERFANLTAKKDVQFEACGVKFPKKPITIPAGMMTLFPVNMPVGDALLTYATAQPVAQRDGKMWFEQKAGITAEFCFGGKVETVKHTSAETPFATIGGIQLYLISTAEAEHLFLKEKAPSRSARRDFCLRDKSSCLSKNSPRGEKNDGRKEDNFQLSTFNFQFAKLREAGALRTITIGKAKVAESPVDADFDQAAIYRITLPTDSTARQGLIQIRYRGDVARLYANGKLVADNFYNGRPFLMGLWRLPAEVTELELRILPLQKDMPVYFPREADTTPGEEVINVTLKP